MTGPLPRHRRRRALLAASTAAQFTELLRVARALREAGDFDVVFWIQLVPHKLAEAMALCDAEGFHYFARPLGGEARAVAGPGAAPGAGEDEEPAVPFVSDVLADLRRDRWSPHLWARLAGALVHRARVRVWRGWLYLLLGARTARQGPVTRALGFLRRQLARLGGALMDAAQALGFRGLPRPLRPLAFPLFLLAYAVFDRRQLFTLTSLYRHYRRLLAGAAEVVRQADPDIVVVAEDALYDYATIVHQARRRRIPTVVVPYTIATAAEPAEAITNDPDFERAYRVGRWYTRLAARLLPHWTHRYGGHTLLRYPVWLAVLYEALRLAPRRPWVFNDGSSVALAAESAHMADLYRREGLAGSYVVLTGAVYDDTAAEVEARRPQARAALLGELGLPPRGRLVVCALPPRMELERRPGCEFQSHEQVVEAMLRPLLDLPDTAVVLSLHPTLRAADLRFAEEWGARISTRPIAELVPCADLFVAVISATIRIAIASAVPVVNYDVFRYGYRDYESARGVVTVDTEAAYRETIARLAGDPRALAALRAAQAGDAPRWGFRDGRSAEALLGLFRYVIEHGTPRGYTPPGRAA